MNYIPRVYRKEKNALQYERNGLKFDIVVSTLTTRDVELKQDKKELGRSDKKDDHNGDPLYVRGRSSKKDDGFKKKEGFNQKADPNHKNEEVLGMSKRGSLTKKIVLY